MKKIVGLILCPLIMGPIGGLAQRVNNVKENKQDTTRSYQETYRPQLHFTPKAHWNNDPNGMVYYAGVYHLFFQYYPVGTQWGPMHWGHAISKDLLHWDEKAIALYPDSLGYIFSGSAVVDKDNTSGFGKNGIVPLVAIFTYHDPKGDKAGRNDFETQAVAYSLDSGKSWVKYVNNPVVKNPGIRDFRDPKVGWYAPTKSWIMTLATKDRITFFSSSNLRDWKKESEFGQHVGSHGGVWECPDLYLVEKGNKLNKTGKAIWVLSVNVGSGAPNGGSATQYFTGDFDGHHFTASDTLTKWLDYGPDEYAGVNWSNTGNDLYFLGWMSNTRYAGATPTSTWRGGMTLTRKLGLVQVDNHYYVTSAPLTETLKKNASGSQQIKKNKAGIYSLESQKLNSPFMLTLNADNSHDFSITLRNKTGDKLVLGYDKADNAYYIDRTAAGKTDFADGFGARHKAPRLATGKEIYLQLIFDKSSVELFADRGKTSMTSLFFVKDGFDKLEISSSQTDFDLKHAALQWIKSIWTGK